MTDSTDQRLTEALSLLHADQHQACARLLAQIVRDRPSHERAWHILSFALHDERQKAYALERVLAINPNNRPARAQLARLHNREHQESTGVITHSTIAKADLGPQGLPAARSVAESTSRWSARFSGLLQPEASQTMGFWSRLRTRAYLAQRRWQSDWQAFSQSPLAVLGLVLIVLFGLMAISHPILMNTVWSRKVYDPLTGFDMAVIPHPSPPGRGHLLGTDTLGRDVLSMLLAATAPTFVVGITAALTTAAIGTVLSVVGAYSRGAIDIIITNLADVFLLFPAPIIMVIIGARFRDLGPVQLGLIYGLVTGAGATTIVLRAYALQVASRPYMEAARIAGGGALHMITKHMLPAMMPMAALQMMIAVTGAVVADGFISFFGLTRTSSNWGTIIYDAFVYASIGSTEGGIWHMLLPAAISFSLFALGFYLVSRGLHRVASPTIREDPYRA